MGTPEPLDLKMSEGGLNVDLVRCKSVELFVLPEFLGGKERRLSENCLNPPFSHIDVWFLSGGQNAIGRISFFTVTSDLEAKASQKNLD